MQALEDVLDSGGLPNPLDDARLIDRYRRRGGDPRRLIYLSLGESWTGTAPGLVAALARGLPHASHGYTLSPYGSPALRRVLRDYIADTHGLPSHPAPGADYDVAVSQSGTRAAMFDFGRLLAPDGARGRYAGTVLAPAPGWDYAGIYAPLGYRVRFYDLDPGAGYQPRVEQIVTALSRAEPGIPLMLVLNAQHNPTAANWEPDIVRALVRAALDHGAALLVDDAYYAVHDPGVRPTNTLGILLDEAAGHRRGSDFSWLAARTLGKQFRCNGWGIGAVTAHPRTLAALADLRHHHSFGAGLPLQAAMAAWLHDRGCEQYLRDMRHRNAQARRHVIARLAADLRFPASAYHAGECTSYLRFRVPPQHLDAAGSADGFRERCLDRAGVLLGRGSMTAPPPAGRASDDPRVPATAYVRLFFGLPGALLDEALDRMAEADLGWDGSPR
ncbi:aminotransferase class I/II-fold pyridoxal phosphate-dependent enzyme [Actinomadura flavalba]|uniref:aminotransferase class I/II-fold pyridoxal phosphate-dependent enzyme n=1 Tax=Actinomadura flavalba TaxID=1120938 RepID=UPI000367AB5F|nr:pyridoxal phosphate-dependent aminotransferase [Actinomadura flavalba]